VRSDFRRPEQPKGGSGGAPLDVEAKGRFFVHTPAEKAFNNQESTIVIQDRPWRLIDDCRVTIVDR
jgi:hypothetical protein